MSVFVDANIAVYFDCLTESPNAPEGTKIAVQDIGYSAEVGGGLS